MKLQDEISEMIDKIRDRYRCAMSDLNERSAVYINIERKVKSSNTDDLIAKNNTKLNILVQNSVMEYTARILAMVDRQLVEVKDRIDSKLSSIAQDIQTHTATKFNDLSSITTESSCVNVDGAATKADSTRALAASGAFGCTAATAVLSISGTTVATGFTIFGFSTGYGAVLPFLASNPVGWAVGAALVTGGLGYMIFKKKITSDSIVENLREKRVVENSLDHLLNETEKLFENIKSDIVKELETIINDLVFKAHRLLDERKRLRSIESSEFHRKVGEIEIWIRSTKSLQEKLSATRKFD